MYHGRCHQVRMFIHFFLFRVYVWNIVWTNSITNIFYYILFSEQLALLAFSYSCSLGFDARLWLILKNPMQIKINKISLYIYNKQRHSIRQNFTRYHYFKFIFHQISYQIFSYDFMYLSFWTTTTLFLSS